MRPSAEPASRPWSPSARVSANASAVSATVPPAGCGCVTTHGSNYLADDFQQEVAFFGIDSSPSFVREPEGNGVAERFIRTLKENLLWVRSFETIEELRLALLAFKRTYNEQWMLEKYDYRSPAQVPTRPRRTGRGSVEANTVKPLSKNSGALHCSLTHIVAKGLNHELAKGQILFQCTNLALPKEFAREVPDV